MWGCGKVWFGWVRCGTAGVSMTDQNIRQKRYNMDLDFYLADGEQTWLDIATRVSQIMPLGEQSEMCYAIDAGLLYPGTPILRNAGSRLNMLSCHSWVVEDSIEEIFEAATVAALVFKSGGGGIGLDLSNLQPSSSPLRYIKRSADIGQYGKASGPLGFWPLFMTISAIIGKWRSGKPSGSMGTLNWAHPDSHVWVSCKRKDGQFNESNLTITIDNWSNLSIEDQMFIAESAWYNGTPGVCFLDNANANNPVLKECGRMTTLNVCSEVIGWHATACVLSSLNLPRVIKRLGDWTRLREIARLQTRLLDRVLDVNHYPHRAFRQQAQKLRQIGNSLMGWGDLLKREGIEYGGATCNDLANELSREFADATNKASWELAGKKGGYMPGRARNVYRRSIAPNGHIAPLAGVSPSIYLNFNDPAEYAESLRLSPGAHVRHLAVWAANVDSGISYTLPLRNDSTPEDVKDVFTLAYELGIKSLSVYRDGSRKGQPCKADGTCDL